MSLEEKLDANTAAIEKLTAVLEVAFAAKEVGKTEKKPGKAKEKAAKKEDSGESMFEDNDDPAEEITLKDLQTALKEFVAEKSKDDAKKLLKKFKVAKLPDLEEEKYGEVLTAINKQLKK